MVSGRVPETRTSRMCPANRAKQNKKGVPLTAPLFYPPRAPLIGQLHRLCRPDHSANLLLAQPRASFFLFFHPFLPFSHPFYSLDSLFRFLPVQ